MSKKHQEVMNKMFEGVQDLIEATYKQGRTDQAVVEQGHREGSASTAKAAFARGYKKGNKHGKSLGYQLGTQDVISASKASYEEGRIAGYEEGKIDGKAVAGVVLRKAYLEGRYEGFSEGHKEGSAVRNAPAITEAHEQGYKEGSMIGDATAIVEAHEQGYTKGYAAGRASREDSFKAERMMGYEHGYEVGRAEQAAETPEPESEPASFAFLAGYTTEAEYRERRDQRVEPKTSGPGPVPVFARANGKPWIPEDQPEQEHATNREADPEPKSTIELELHVDPALLRYFPFMSRLNILLPKT